MRDEQQASETGACHCFLCPASRCHT